MLGRRQAFDNTHRHSRGPARARFAIVRRRMWETRGSHLKYVFATVLCAQHRRCVRVWSGVGVRPHPGTALRLTTVFGQLHGEHDHVDMHMVANKSATMWYVPLTLCGLRTAVGCERSALAASRSRRVRVAVYVSRHGGRRGGADPKVGPYSMRPLPLKK